MIKKEIKERQPKSDAIVHNNAVLNRVFQNRGITSIDDLDLSMKNLLNPFLIKDMDKATDSLIDHYYSDSRICIVGDFDCDGATSTSIMSEGLTMLGFKNVSYVIPDRQVHGYGLTPGIVDVAKETANPDIIITVDCGISSFDGAERVYELGMELIITDHHLQAEAGVIPPCEAAININRTDCTFPSKNLAGCGVAFYLMIALRKKMRDLNIFTEKGVAEPDLSRMLDLVSLGTVADLVALDKNNRILVRAGLERTRRGLAREGISEIFRQKKKEISKATSQDWGFTLGPILNAAGRLENMTKGIEMLLDNNPGRVQDRVQELIELNEKRKQIGKEMEMDTDAILENEDVNMGVVVFQPDWHEGVVGITASRVKEKTNRPVICLTETHEAKDAREKYELAVMNNHGEDIISECKANMDASLIKGSCRSIPGVHIRDVLDLVAKRAPGVLAKFGGHAMAAGVSLYYDKLDVFKHEFDKACEEAIEPHMIQDNVTVDIHNIDPELLSLETAELIASNDPWGQRFEPPLFSGQFMVREVRPIGDGTHLKMSLSPLGSTKTVDAIMFRCVEPGMEPRVKANHQIEAVYKMDVNEWNGFKNVQLMLDYFYDEEYELSKQHEKDVATQFTI
ncbi:single-stranded-DNA-specific exonuclease RecJ [Vibrio splendidus]|nr:DHH family phosphoesterase [Vibrio splendidus]MCC4881488.1 DHHA1 domain-containing protein [Vibrio splendidus]